TVSAAAFGNGLAELDHARAGRDAVFGIELGHRPAALGQSQTTAADRACPRDQTQSRPEACPQAAQPHAVPNTHSNGANSKAQGARAALPAAPPVIASNH